MAKGKKGKAGKEESPAAPPECKPKSKLPEISIPTLLENYRAIYDVLLTAFKDDTDRVNLETAWGNYMVFRTKRDDREFYFVYTGCSCDFKQMSTDIQYFATMHEAIKFIVTASVLNTMHIPELLDCCRNKCINKICKNYQPPKTCKKPKPSNC